MNRISKKKTLSRYIIKKYLSFLIVILLLFSLTRINRKSLFYIFPLCVTLKKKGVFHYVTYG